jgi:hypothetical protein
LTNKWSCRNGAQNEALHAYVVQFALINDTTSIAPLTSDPKNFIVDFGGETLFTETNTPADAYTLYPFTGIATRFSVPLPASGSSKSRLPLSTPSSGSERNCSGSLRSS